MKSKAVLSAWAAFAPLLAPAIASFFTSVPALAQPVTITDQRCVAADFDRAFKHVVDYDGYSRSAGAKYGVSLGFSTLPLLTMFYSRGTFLSRDGYATDAYVGVSLQPVNLTNSKYFPTFVIRCQTASPGAGALEHRCQLVNEMTVNGATRSAPRYGLQNFTSTLKVTAAAPDCLADRPTKLDYVLLLDGNSAEIAEIKAQALAPAGLLAPAIGKLFVEEDFFRNYYQNFYNGWIKGI